MNVAEIPQRTLSNPALNFKEVNAILQFLKNISDNRRITTSQYGTSFRDTSKRRFINVKFHTELEPYSIFSIEQFGTIGSSFEIYIPHPAGTTIYQLSELTANQGETYLTNGGTKIFPTMNFDCEIIGYHKPHLIRYSDVNGRPIANDKMAAAPYNFAPDQYKVKVVSTGPFMSVSDGDEATGLVWIVRTDDKGYLPWVKTCTHPDYPDYPIAPANVFVVERGKYSFNDAPTPPLEQQTPVFIACSPREFYIAFSKCGYLEEGTILRMSNDCGRWYLMRECT